MTGVPFTRLLSTYPNARLAVESAFGADLAADPTGWTWADITTDVQFTGPVAISPMGRSDETSKVQPAGCKFRLLNTSGKYGTGPGSQYFPNVRRNTPIRVRVTLDGSTWYTRFQGQATGFTPSWDTTGKIPMVDVAASGKLRQMGQGKSPLKSAMYRSITRNATSALLAYWPMEDGNLAPAFASPIAGVAPMSYRDTLQKASYAGFLGSAPIPMMGANAETIGVVPPYTPNGTIAFRALMTLPAAGVPANGHVFRIYQTGGGNTAFWALYIDTNGNPDLEANDANATIINNTGSLGFYANGTRFELILNMVQSGADANVTTIFRRLNNDGTILVYTDNYLMTGVGVGQVTSVYCSFAGNLNGSAVGHVAVANSTSVSYSNPVKTSLGYLGETATDRLTRLCLEEGVPIAITGTSDTKMGPQGVSTLLDLLRECETADDGVLYDGRSTGLSYTARTSRYNATAALTANMAAYQVDDPFTPADDDQRNRNLVEVKRKNGSSAVYEDNFSPLGTQAIETYDSSLTVNTDNDTGLLNRAAWEVGKGTVPGLRYPSLNLNLGAVPALASSWLTAGVSSRINVNNVAAVALNHPPGDLALLLEGWSEKLTPYEWTITANCSPFQPWHVGALDGAGDVAFRLDSGNSTLAAAAALGATSLSVNVNDGYLWSTSAGDYPRDIDVGGAKVTVTAVAGASSPQTFTVTALPYALTAGWKVKLWHPATLAL